MSSDWGLQQIIGAALTDCRVLAALVENPLSLADRFGLTIPERRFIVNARARNLEHFASQVQSWRDGVSPIFTRAHGRPERLLLVS